jgi:hypothetical protein
MRGALRSVAPALLLVGIVAPSGAFAAVPSVASRWAAAPPVVDGRPDEWAGEALSHDRKSGADFAFRNDGGNLYILVTLKDPEAAEALLASGLKVFGRPARPGAAPSGVLFVARSVSADAYIGWEVGQGTVLTEAEKAELRKAGRGELHLAYAIGPSGSIFGPIGRAPRGAQPDFAEGGPENATSFEIRIPLASPKETTGAIGAAPGEALRVSFDWGGGENRELSTPGSNATKTLNSGYLSGTGRTWSQEFLDTFDSMARPFSNAKRYSFSVDVWLAASR